MLADQRFLVEGRGLVVRFGETVVLEGVDIVIPERQVITVIGPNGAGKTALIRVLLGLAAADSGVVRRRPGLRIGYVPQRLHVDQTLPLTVQRFLGLARDGQRLQEVLAVLEEVAVARLIDKPMQRISGGEMQRVLLARALLHDPDLLVLDEPAQGVDVGGQGALYTLIARLRDRRRCGVLMVSHDLHLVMAATDHVICLNRHVCCAGAPELVRQHPEYMSLFGMALWSSVDTQTLAVYQHHHDHRHGLDGVVQASSPETAVPTLTSLSAVSPP
ncbi:MAG: zinc transporter [Rhodospirillaceae bacterium]|nr:MAG: zinc transporter [Rhodospirillaceae bacterium]